MLKGALVGFGAVAQNAHAPAFRGNKDFAISAIAEADPQRLRSAAAAFPGARLYPNLEALLEQESALDFVDLATPPWLHGRQTLLALERGLHVLCEKPLTLDSEELRRVAQAARQNDRTIFTVHNWACAPIWAKARELSARGEIGPVHHAEIHVARTKPSVAAGPGDWRTDPKLSGGGILVDHGWHALYLLKSILFPSGKASLPIETMPALSRPSPKAAEVEATVLFRFPEATALLHLTWRAASRSNWAIFHGSRASLELRDDHLLLRPASGPEQRFDFPEKLSAGSAHPEWFASMLPDFSREVSEPQARGHNLAEAEFALTLIRQSYDGQVANRAGLAEAASR
jgi:predicted dehydrogenase